MKFYVRISERNPNWVRYLLKVVCDSNLSKDDTLEPPFQIDRLFVIFYSPRLRDVKDEGKIKEQKNGKNKKNQREFRYSFIDGYSFDGSYRR